MSGTHPKGVGFAVVRVLGWRNFGDIRWTLKLGGEFMGKRPKDGSICVEEET